MRRIWSKLSSAGGTERLLAMMLVGGVALVAVLLVIAALVDQA